jgi:hypothetical protein
LRLLSSPCSSSSTASGFRPTPVAGPGRGVVLLRFRCLLLGFSFLDCSCAALMTQEQESEEEEGVAGAWIASDSMACADTSKHTDRKVWCAEWCASRLV